MPTLIEIGVPMRRRARRGIRLYRTRLPDDEVTVVQGIPVTTVPRTLFDIASVLDRRQVERAINEAEALRLTDPLSLADLVARYPRRRGVSVIKSILATGRIGADITRSELEDRFLAAIDAACLSWPEVNAIVEVGGQAMECDCVWRKQRVIVELDGHATHATSLAYERDRERDRLLTAARWRVVRVTWRQLHDNQARVMADLRALLATPADRHRRRSR